MKMCARAFLLFLICLIAGIPSFTQEVFRNPGMEPDDEFGRRFSRAQALARDNKHEEAIKLFKEAAKLKNGDCSACFSLAGQSHFQLARYKDSAEAFRQALALKTDREAEINNYLGVSLYLQNDKKLLEEAAAAFRRAIELDADRLPKSHYNLGYTLIKLGREEEGIAQLKIYLEKSPSSPDASQVRAVMANPRLASETLAVEFKVKSFEGEELSLEKLKGKVVLLDFWATWCKPCIFEMPEVKNLWKKYREKPFVIIGVSLDDSESALRSYLEKEGIEWPQFFDGRGWDNRVSKLYNVRSIPHTVLIDHEGVVRAVGLRGGRLSGKINDLINKIPKASGGQ